MYNHTGKTIKGYALDITTMIIAPSAFLGFVVFCLILYLTADMWGVGGVLVAMIVAGIIIGPAVWWARLFGSVLNGFGIIVEKMENSDVVLSNNDHSQVADEKSRMEQIMKNNAVNSRATGISAAYKAWTSPDTHWVCTFCGASNKADSDKCEMCGWIKRET